MKKIYNKPTVKTVSMLPVSPLAMSGEQVGVNVNGERRQLSREADSFSWDDDEEEDTGGWFK